MTNRKAVLACLALALLWATLAWGTYRVERAGVTRAVEMEDARRGGRETVSYRPLSCEHERDQIDATLLDALGISRVFLDELRGFVRSTVVVDDHDARRHAVRSHFQGSEITA